jgi:hypothetical protein
MLGKKFNAHLSFFLHFFFMSEDQAKGFGAGWSRFKAISRWVVGDQHPIIVRVSFFLGMTAAPSVWFPATSRQ